MSVLRCFALVFAALFSVLFFFLLGLGRIGLGWVGLDFFFFFFALHWVGRPHALFSSCCVCPCVLAWFYYTSCFALFVYVLCLFFCVSLYTKYCRVAV